jgi:hypothetical protein
MRQSGKRVIRFFENWIERCARPVADAPVPAGDGFLPITPGADDPVDHRNFIFLFTLFHCLKEKP